MSRPQAPNESDHQTQSGDNHDNFGVTFHSVFLLWIRFDELIARDLAGRSEHSAVFVKRVQGYAKTRVLEPRLYTPDESALASDSFLGTHLQSQGRSGGQIRHLTGI